MGNSHHSSVRGRGHGHQHHNYHLQYSSTDAASEILGKKRRRKKPRVTRDVLVLFDERRDLRRSGMEQKEERNTGKQTEEDSEGSEESKGGLNRCSV